jgi:arginyl-tRNA synthetase
MLPLLRLTFYSKLLDGVVAVILAQRDSWLALCDVTARTLAHALDLLGIAAPETM